MPTGRIACLLVAAAAVALMVSGADAGPGLPSGLPVAAHVKLQPVTEQASLTTRVQGESFVTRREVFEFLLDHPEFATHVTRALRLARYRIWRTPEGLAIDDGWGTTGTFELVHASRGTRLLYARGVYHHRILPDIHGQAVVAIDFDVAVEPGGRDVISPVITGFVKLDSRLLALAGKLAGSVATAKAEKEAHRLVKIFRKTTGAIDADPAGVYETLRQQPDVPRGDLERFRQLLSLPVPAAAAAR